MPTISTLAKLAARSPAPVIQLPLSDSSFKLDFSGIAGFFGGDSAWKAVASIYILPQGTPPDLFQVLGAYNSPGAYEVVKRCAPIANSTFWDSIFPGEDHDAARILGLEGKRGPMFIQTSGETVRTGHPAYLVAQKAQECCSPGTRSNGCSVTIIDLTPKMPPASPVVRGSQAWNLRIRLREISPLQHASGYVPGPTLSRMLMLWGIPVYGSIATIILCGLVRDWWCFSSILVGLFAGGFMRMGLKDEAGRRRLEVVAPRSALLSGSRKDTEQVEGPPPHQEGDHMHKAGGLLLHEHGAITVLRGDKYTVVDLTRGRFHIEFGAQDTTAALHVGLSALITQFLTQIVLIPQGTLFGQLMFVTSLGLSAMYNIYLAMQQDTLQTQYLLDLYGLRGSSFKRTNMRSKAGMAVFACLALRHLPLYAPRKILDKLITEEGTVWRRWKDLVARELQKPQMVFVWEEQDIEGLVETEENELKGLLEDAKNAYRDEGWKVTIPESDGQTSQAGTPGTISQARSVATRNQSERRRFPLELSQFPYRPLSGGNEDEDVSMPHGTVPVTRA